MSDKIGVRDVPVPTAVAGYLRSLATDKPGSGIVTEVIRNRRRPPGRYRREGLAHR
jgi:hypothetical protein